LNIVDRSVDRTLRLFEINLTRLGIRRRAWR
jgi:hypothetical protein